MPEYASPWRRAAAFILEMVTVTVASFAIMVPFTYLLKALSVPVEDAERILKVGGLGLPLVFYFINFIVLPVTYWKTTLGGRLLKFHIVRADGGKPGALRITARAALFLFVPSLPAILATRIAQVEGMLLSAVEWVPFLLWVTPALFMKQRTALHDIITHTRVVKGRTEKPKKGKR